MASVLTVAPALEPLTLAEAKAHLRVDFVEDDTLISALIVAARQRAEVITRRALITQSWQLVLDAFPVPGMNVGSANWYGPQWGNSPGPLTTLRADGRTGFEIFLDHTPVSTVNSITYTDVDGNTQTLSPSLYKTDFVTEPCRVVPAYGTSWPGTRNEISAVSVAYTCGYGSAGAAVPEAIRQWMRLRVGAMYENREEFLTGQRITMIELPFIDGILQDYRVQTF